ncbi:MAG: phosphotransferase [Actinomycetota bacterium]|nr:phosphotransferase [Actinomycetota bacterium]
MVQTPSPAVPRTREELLEPTWLQTALDDIADDDTIVAVEATGTSKTRLEKLQFAVTMEGPAGRRVGRYCAKATLDGSDGGSAAEAMFYLDVAPRLDVRRPGVHYAAVEGTASIIVMDDIVALGGKFMNPHFPFTTGIVRATLAQLARLHGTTWGLGPVADIPWLDHGLARFAAMQDAEALQKLLDDGRADGFPAEIRSGENLLRALRAQQSLGVTSLLHGDTHTGNVYLDPAGRGSFFDWEVVQTGHWAQDVAYHLGTALTIDDRRAHEEDLLRFYLAELAATGAPAPSFAEAWDLYRKSFGYGYLLWVITMIRGRDEVLQHMPRLGAALTDHQTYRLLGIA